MRTRRLLAAGVVGATLAAQALLAGAAPGTAPPPTPVEGRPSPFQTSLTTPPSGVRSPQIAASSALLADLGRGIVLLEKAADEPRPIASLTKVMTALLTLERARLGDVVRIDRDAVFEPGDYGYGSTLHLRAGEELTVEDLLYGMLLGSANDAAVALAIHVAGSEEAFVRMMNARAKELGMVHTRFRSPNGLDDRGVSTATDLLKLVLAVEEIPAFRSVVRARFHTLPGPQGGRRIQNRNVLLWLYEGADGIKTGFTYGAGYCLIATAERGGRRLAAIVLNAPREAFSAAAALLNHGFEGFTEQVLVAEGEDRGTIDLPGGSVPVVAGEGLTALVPVSQTGQVRTRVRVSAAAAFPPIPGQRVGTLSVTIGGKAAGQVPLLAASVPPPEREPGPWWARATASLAGAVAGFIDGLVG